ncbi:hypothetical protein JCM14076_09860 [Methylosoma difficile]
MKKLFFLILCSLMMGNAIAQTPEGDSPSINPFEVKQQVEQMAKDLKLTDSQTEQFENVFKNQFIKHRVGPNTLTDEARASLKSLLSDQQLLQLDGWLANAKKTPE